MDDRVVDYEHGEQGEDTYTRPQVSGSSIAQKLAEVTLAIDSVGRGGYNTAQHYKFVEWADVAALVRGELAKRNVSFVVNSIKPWGDAKLIEVPKKDDNGLAGYLVTAIVGGSFIDADTGQYVYVETLSQGVDKGDKAGNSLMSSAVKYIMLKTFQIPTDDDAESNESFDRAAGNEQTWRWGAEHKGKPYSEVPEKDLAWLAGNDKYGNQSQRNAAAAELKRRGETKA